MLNELLVGSTFVKVLKKVNFIKEDKHWNLQKKITMGLQMHLILQIRIILMMNYELYYISTIYYSHL
ncbi:unnamed protein product [Paramecium pentaurelia]|uniref:Uncharacterized protein n=1 Tax=Paramecium pentaurelia TaxID=43138 RepID=A0A8S1SSR3_9CILI|nr:unnamed protein product [Paramecium pentaurelia]